MRGTEKANQRHIQIERDDARRRTRSFSTTLTQLGASRSRHTGGSVSDTEMRMWTADAQHLRKDADDDCSVCAFSLFTS
ncbi:hypothetical protein E1301_Tti022728 [Triplophysa tibetana]|uniref:Uncharacterized protein n=1 Tax=Triplophysa tibetana TaxID=1572043 RepID=A0A5A9P2L5_9TELE|nr:hypothetical protein E1301_Tti022728 [Triplophysa tibetana]